MKQKTKDTIITIINWIIPFIIICIIVAIVIAIIGNGLDYTYEEPECLNCNPYVLCEVNWFFVIIQPLIVAGILLVLAWIIKHNGSSSFGDTK